MEKKTESLRRPVFLYANRAAKILAVFFAAFLSIFSFDAVSKDNSFLENAMSLLIHLIPAFMILITLILAWKKPMAGVVIYPLLAIAYIIWAWGRFPLSVYFLIAGPMFLVALLFWLGSLGGSDKFMSKKMPPITEAFFEED